MIMRRKKENIFYIKVYIVDQPNLEAKGTFKDDENFARFTKIFIEIILYCAWARNAENTLFFYFY